MPSYVVKLDCVREADGLPDALSVSRREFDSLVQKSRVSVLISHRQTGETVAAILLSEQWYECVREILGWGRLKSNRRKTLENYMYGRWIRDLRAMRGETGNMGRMDFYTTDTQIGVGLDDQTLKAIARAEEIIQTRDRRVVRERLLYSMREMLDNWYGGLSESERQVLGGKIEHTFD